MQNPSLNSMFAFLAIASAAIGCRTLPMSEPDSYGLKLVELRVSNENESVLNSTVWEKTPVGADLSMGDLTTRVDLKYSGRSSLDDFKKNYEIRFRQGESYRGRRELKLSAQAIDPSAMRSMLGFWAYKQAGIIASDIEPAALYINGNYRGLYFFIENVDEEFFHARGIDRGIVYKAIFGNAGFTEKTLADPGNAFDVPFDQKDYTAVKRLCEIVLSNRDVASRVAELEAIVAPYLILDYVAATVALNHFDGFANNYYFFLDRKLGRYRVLPWDLDRIYEQDSVVFTPRSTIYGDNRLSSLLLQAPAYKKYYLEKLQSLISGPLSVAAIVEKSNEIRGIIGPAWQADRVLSSKGRTIDSEASELLQVITAWHKLLGDDLNAELEILNK